MALRPCDTERRRIIQRLIKKLTAGEQANLQEDYITTAAKYTGLHPKVLRNLETIDVYETTIKPVDRSVTYNKLVQFYTRNKIPSTYELFSSLYGEIPSYIDIGNFRKILVKMGFVWKKVTSENAVVIENPLVRFERYNYLKKIQFHRESGADIYYIDNVSYDSNGNMRDAKLSRNLLVDVLRNEWFQRVVYALGPEGVHALEEINSFSSDEIEEWVRDVLMTKITKPSVFVLKNAEHHNRKLLETPTLDSLKSDTIRWLDRHGVTYNPKMSKYELFALAERYTDLNVNLFKIDEMLKVNGHTVLRIPKCIENVTSAALLYRIMNESLADAIVNKGLESVHPVNEIKTLFQDLIATVSATYIDTFERYIADKEAEMVSVEDKVDEIYDSLISKWKGNKCKDMQPDSDLPSCSDSE